MLLSSRTTIFGMPSLESTRRAAISALRDPISFPISAWAPTFQAGSYRARENLRSRRERAASARTAKCSLICSRFEIDIWGRLRRATESAQAQLFAADWNRKTVITTLISDVATAYFNLLELDMELAIARNTLGTREESLRLLRTQLRGGVGTLLDVRQGEQLVYTAAEVIPDDERQIQQTENQISLLLGKEPRTRGARQPHDLAANSARGARRVARRRFLKGVLTSRRPSRFWLRRMRTSESPRRLISRPSR